MLPGSVDVGEEPRIERCTVGGYINDQTPEVRAVVATSVELYTSLEPRPVVPSRNSYRVTPLPAVQVKVALEPASVLLGVGEVNAAGTGVPDSRYV